VRAGRDVCLQANCEWRISQVQRLHWGRPGERSHRGRFEQGQARDPSVPARVVRWIVFGSGREHGTRGTNSHDGTPSATLVHAPNAVSRRLVSPSEPGM
jgi:hypothetical protein